MPDQFRVDARFGGIAINVPDREALFSRIVGHFRAGTGFALATLNLDHLVKLRSDRAFREAYRAQDLVCADGNPIVWVSRLAGRPVSLVPGADLVQPLAALAAEHNVSVALIGSTDAALAGAAESLTRTTPGLEIAARISPAMGFDPEGAAAGEIIDAIRISGARLVFLALGAPRQERFAARLRRELPGVGLASIGAGLDFLAGHQVRAPEWMRRSALEWLWRMASNPRRLAARYASCAVLLPALAADSLALRFETGTQIPATR